MALVASLWFAAELPAREVALTILHTTDLHGHILPGTGYDGQTNVGGLARCATMIRQVRAEQPNTLVVDAGDTIQGTAASFYSDGLVMVKALNLLRYDAWVWGNHEFDWGVAKLTGCARRAEMPILNANVTREGWPLKPYLVREIDGVKVGIIGLNTPGIPNWSRPRLITGVTVAESVETLKTVVPAVRKAGAQVLVLVCHQGYREAGDDHANQVGEMARNFPELDVIIGAHTHREFPEFKLGGKVLYCQAGYHGAWLGRVDLVFDTVKGRVTRETARTLLMDDKVPVDAVVVASARDELARAEKILAEEIGQATADFEAQGAPKRETAVRALICESIGDALQRQGVTVDAVVHGLLDRHAAIRQGVIRVGDVWRIMPYENTIGFLRTSRDSFREIMEEEADAYEKRAFRGIWGLEWTFNPKARSGQRTVSLTRADGSAVTPRARLTVAFNSYDLASGGLRWNRLREMADRPGSQLVETDIHTREAVIEYIRRRGSIAPAVKQWWQTTN